MTTTVDRPGLSWKQVFAEWETIRWDIHQHFGIDLLRETDGLSWHWLVDMLSALMTMPITAYDPNGNPLFPTRFQRTMKG